MSVIVNNPIEVWIVGPPGSGKTAILELLGSTLTSQGATITLEDCEDTSPPSRWFKDRRLKYVLSRGPIKIKTIQIASNIANPFREKDDNVF